MDIFVGLAILTAGLYLWADMVWMAGIFVPVFLPAWKAARERFVDRRMGAWDHALHLRTQSQKVLLYFTFLIGVFLLAGIGLFFAYGVISGSALEGLRAFFLLGLGGVFASVWVLAAVMLKVNRFYLYALFTFLPLALAQYSSLPFWAALAITGGLVALTGLVVFLNFLQEHPVIEKG